MTDPNLEAFIFTITTATGEHLQVQLQGSGGALGGGCIGAANTLIGNARRASYIERAMRHELAVARAEAEQTGQVRSVYFDRPWETRIEPVAVRSVDSVAGIWWPREPADGVPVDCQK